MVSYCNLNKEKGIKTLKNKEKKDPHQDPQELVNLMVIQLFKYL